MFGRIVNYVCVSVCASYLDINNDNCKIKWHPNQDKRTQIVWPWKASICLIVWVQPNPISMEVSRQLEILVWRAAQVTSIHMQVMWHRFPIHSIPPQRWKTVAYKVWMTNGMCRHCPIVSQWTRLPTKPTI